MIHRYSLEAPTTPGAGMTVQSTHRTLEEARRAAKRFRGRRDLTYQDVLIWSLLENKRKEYAGPSR